MNFTKGTLLLMLSLSIAVFNCKKDKDSNDACFNVSTSGLTAYFDASCSKNAESYAWSFGDGGVSSQSSPSRTYSSSGTYQVTLVTTNSNGASSSVSKSVEVSSGSNNNNNNNSNVCVTCTIRTSVPGTQTVSSTDTYCGTPDDVDLYESSLRQSASLSPYVSVSCN